MKHIVTVRGRLKPEAGQAAHDAIVDRLSPVSRPLGALGHQPYLNPQDPQDFLAVDTWQSLEGLQQFMAHPENPGAAIASLFEAPPTVTVYSEAGWRTFLEQG